MVTFCLVSLTSICCKAEVMPDNAEPIWYVVLLLNSLWCWCIVVVVTENILITDTTYRFGILLLEVVSPLIVLFLSLLAWSLLSVICWAFWFWTTCLLLFFMKPPLALALPKGMQKFWDLTDGSTKLPPVRIPLPLMSDVEALLPGCHPPGGASLSSDPARLFPEVTFTLPELLYTLPSLLPTA